MRMQLDAVMSFDHFPHVRAQALDFDATQVINRLLEGSLPPSVASLDPKMPMAAAEPASASLPSSSAAGLSVNGVLCAQHVSALQCPAATPAWLALRHARSQCTAPVSCVTLKTTSAG